ncbi:lipopolysaccharide biosynthesis protein [Paenibacillus contaminans]|uniref:lipopolysaccharide biosynthesis protein n=1 Tax=Paenibacillus contaminans TaxID=450362 RepID=UPI001314D919|nr:oligosaccharide flippase family protein [Paenibacillus contaminans]
MSAKIGVNRFAKDSLIYIPCKILECALGFVTMLYYTRLFVPEEYGAYSLISSGVAFAVTVSTGWYNQAAIRYYDESKNSAHYFSGLLTSWITVNGVMLVLFLGSLLLFQGSDFHSYGVYIVLLYITANSYAIMQSLLSVSRKVVTYAVLSVTILTLRFCLTVYLSSVHGMGITALLASTIVFDLIAFTFCIFRMRFHRSLSIRGWEWASIRPIVTKFLRYGIPLMGYHVVSYVLTVSDRYMIAYFRHVEEVGIYAFGYTLVQSSMYLFISSIMQAAFPHIIESWNRSDKESTERLVSRFVSVYFFLMIPAAVGITMLRQPIFSILADQSYFDGSRILPWVTLGVFFMGLTMYSNKIFELTERTKHILYMSLLAAIVNVGLNMLAIPAYGYIAAAVTTFVAYLLYFVLSVTLSRKSFRFLIEWGVLVKIVAASIGMAGFLYTCKSYIDSIGMLAVSIAAGVIVYLILLLSFGLGRAEAQSVLLRMKRMAAGRKSRTVKADAES